MFKGQVGAEKGRLTGRAPLLSLPPPLNPASASAFAVAAATVAVAKTSDRTCDDATAPSSSVTSCRGCDTTWACPPPEQCPNQIRQMRRSCHGGRRGSECVPPGRGGRGGRGDRRRMSRRWRGRPRRRRGGGGRKGEEGSQGCRRILRLIVTSSLLFLLTLTFPVFLQNQN